MVLESSDTEDEHNSVDAGVPRTPFNTPVEGTHSYKTVLSTKQLEVYSYFLFWFLRNNTKSLSSKNLIIHVFSTVFQVSIGNQLIVTPS